MFKPDQEVVITVRFPRDVSEEVLQLLHEKREMEGPTGMGELLVKSIIKDLYSTTEIAKQRGITRRGAAKAAREEATKGNPWPQKNDNGDWVAPLVEWERIFKKRKKKTED
ncbi:hypothetical protein [Desmospora activa]|uniref:Uncharacterized protein n=1 Tax=Desmospora activa DSM 45169 TaxID=1121389 RepID=A0A2T4YZS5_9BACL|nr:hypothetical protein [Desmospora activa]PTM52709.1 hypothetical protein C8J48_3702 [Desmospora activa DSM 45169]